jgi:hypothetical protein
MLPYDLIPGTLNIIQWTGIQLFFVPIAGGLLTYFCVVPIIDYLMPSNTNNSTCSTSVSSDDSSSIGSSTFEEERPLLHYY